MLQVTREWPYAMNIHCIMIGYIYGYDLFRPIGSLVTCIAVTLSWSRNRHFHWMVMGFPQISHTEKGSSWSWSHGSCAISAYHNQICEFEPRSLRGALDTTLCYKVCQWFAAGRWFSLGPPVSSTNKTDHDDITEILLKVALSTIKPNQSRKKNDYQ